MSWTTLATVRKHLQETAVAAATVENEEHVLSGTSAVQLAHSSISSGSEEIKTIDAAAPTAAGSFTLNGTSWVSLTHQNLVPNTVVVADDEALDTVYVEGTDYVIDYENGKIKRVTGTAIGDGNAVYVWYFYYTVHNRAADYAIDYDAGQIARVEGGNIADGSTIYADYITSAGTVTDDLINQAITEAEDKILARLKDEYSSSSTDQGLKTGATELTLSIVCNAKSMDMLLKNPSDGADGAAGQWQEMSKRYEAQSWETLDRFLSPRSRRAPQAVMNQSWEHLQE